jgi:hypothetical protein
VRYTLLSFIPIAGMLIPMSSMVGWLISMFGVSLLVFLAVESLKTNS